MFYAATSMLQSSNFHKILQTQYVPRAINIFRSYNGVRHVCLFRLQASSVFWNEPLFPLNPKADILKKNALFTLTIVFYQQCFNIRMCLQMLFCHKGGNCKHPPYNQVCAKQSRREQCLSIALIHF